MNGVDGGGGGGIRFPLNSLLCLPRAHVQQARSEVAAGTAGPQVTPEARSFLGFQHSRGWGSNVTPRVKTEARKDPVPPSALQLGQDPRPWQEEAHTRVQESAHWSSKKPPEAASYLMSGKSLRGKPHHTGPPREACFRNYLGSICKYAQST